MHLGTFPSTALTQGLPPHLPSLISTETCASRLTKDFDRLTLILSPHTLFFLDCDLLVENKEGGMCPSPLFRGGVLGSGQVYFSFSRFLKHAFCTLCIGYHPHLHMASPLHFHPFPMMDFKPHLPQGAFPDAQDALLTYKVPRA